MENILQNRFKYAMIIGGFASVLGAITFLFLKSDAKGNVFLDILAISWLLVTVIAYMLGGFGTMIKTAWGIAKWGWYLIPIFPVDLFLLLLALMLSVMAFLFVPIVPIVIAYSNYKKEQKNEMEFALKDAAKAANAGRQQYEQSGINQQYANLQQSQYQQQYTNQQYVNSQQAQYQQQFSGYQQNMNNNI